MWKKKRNRAKMTHFFFHSLCQYHLHLRFLYNVAQSMGRFRVPKTTYLFCDLLEELRGSKIRLYSRLIFITAKSLWEKHMGQSLEENGHKLPKSSPSSYRTQFL